MAIFTTAQLDEAEDIINSMPLKWQTNMTRGIHRNQNWIHTLPENQNQMRCS